MTRTHWIIAAAIAAFVAWRLLRSKPTGAAAGVGAPTFLRPTLDPNSRMAANNAYFQELRDREPEVYGGTPGMLNGRGYW